MITMEQILEAMEKVKEAVSFPSEPPVAIVSPDEHRRVRKALDEGAVLTKGMFQYRAEVQLWLHEWENRSK